MQQEWDQQLKFGFSFSKREQPLQKSHQNVRFGQLPREKYSHSVGNTLWLGGSDPLGFESVASQGLRLTVTLGKVYRCGLAAAACLWSLSELQSSQPFP